MFLTARPSASVPAHSTRLSSRITYLQGSIVAIMMRRWHPHGRVNRRRRRRTIRGAGGTGVVLATTPAQPNSRIADGITLHLVDGHFRRVTLHELNEAAALPRRYLDVSDLAEPLEEGTELVFGHVPRESANEDGGIVRIRELVHRLGSAVVSNRRVSHGVHAYRALTRHRHAARSSCSRLVFGGCRRDPHRTVAAIDPLHLGESALLIPFIREADKTVTARHAADGVGHDLGGFARREPILEERDQDKLVHFRTKIADKNRVLRSTVVPATVKKKSAG